MEIKSYQMPKTGDCWAWKVEVWEDNKELFSIIRKLSGTEFAIAKNIIKTEKEIIDKLCKFTENEAKGKFKNKKYKIGDKLEGDFSPYWK